MTSERKRIYIVVKTYPTISERYSELVCTAGVLEDGSWIRLYPVPFRKLDFEQKYQKFTWIDVDVVRNTKDFRLETYRPMVNTITAHPKPKKTDWDARRNIVFKNKKVYTNLQELIGKAKSEKTSLAVFKPTKIIDLIVEPAEREWDANKLSILKALSQQLTLDQTPEEIAREFEIVPKVPYKFSYRFEDDEGRKSTLMIEDWEIGMLYFKCLKKAGGDEDVAKQKVRQKYFDDFISKDLHLFLGTTLKFHNIAPNPFVIVGVFPAPFQSPERQMSIFD